MSEFHTPARLLLLAESDHDLRTHLAVNLRADGFVSDVTEEWAAHATLALRNKELAALYRVSELSLASESPEGTYAAVLDEVAGVMDVPVVLLEQLDRTADRLVLLAARGVPAEQIGRASWRERV